MIQKWRSIRSFRCLSWRLTHDRPRQNLGAGEVSTDLILSRLEGVRQTGLGRWIAKCPVHADKRASLLVTPKDDGKITVYCFGCGAKGLDIVAALGLASDALFPQKDTWRQDCRRRAVGPPVRPRRRYLDVDGHFLLFLTAVEWDLHHLAAPLRWRIEQAAAYDKYGPTLKPQPNLKTAPPAWALAARDAA